MLRTVIDHLRRHGVGHEGEERKADEGEAESGDDLGERAERGDQSDAEDKPSHPSSVPSQREVGTRSDDVHVVPEGPTRP